MDNRPHRSSLRKGRVSVPGQVYHISKSLVSKEYGFLTMPGCADIVIQSLLWARDKGWWRIIGFVVMPNHYHLVMALGTGKSLSDALRDVDKYIARRINAMLGTEGQFWEPGFHDHGIRDRNDIDGLLLYIYNNPVRARLVESLDQWPYSTANPVYAAEVDWEWLGHSHP
jgi:REP element-mobilizing transposase RayT